MEEESNIREVEEMGRLAVVEIYKQEVEEMSRLVEEESNTLEVVEMDKLVEEGIYRQEGEERSRLVVEERNRLVAEEIYIQEVEEICI